MKDNLLSLEELLEAKQAEELNESGIRGMKDLAKQYKEAELYFHMDLDGVTSAIGMKAYLEGYGIKVVKCQHIQYGGREFAAEKPAEGRLAVMVDFAHGKPTMHIHTDHHDSQSGVVSGTATSFKHAPSNASTISQEISPKDLFPTEDIRLITMVDSADFARNEITADEVIRAAFEFDKKLGIEKNRTYMGLVCNKMLLAFKNKKDFLEEVVMKSKPSLINMFTNIRKIAVDNGYKLAELTAAGENYVKSQAPENKLKQLKSTEDIFDLGSGEYAMFGNCLVQYGGGVMTKGGYDRYTPFKNNPTAEYIVLAWPLGLVQASKNPFKKGANQFNLGDIAKKILAKYKSKLEQHIVTFDELKRMFEIDIAKKGSKDSFGFGADDLKALFGDAIKGTKFASEHKDLIDRIASKQYGELTDEEKNVLSQVDVDMYQVITRQSGGHKDITNISGINFLGKGYLDLLKRIMVDLVEVLKDAKLS